MGTGNSGLVFGPVPSRRLGMSLGVNNIPPKICSYSCVYCQLGRTLKMSIDRKCYYEPRLIVDEVSRRLEEVEKKGGRVDYVTFVPDGEPTLDACIGETAEKLKELGMRVAVITNASLIWRDDVRRDLEVFDYVSAKVDAVSVHLWRRINRPHPSLDLAKILSGLQLFSRTYRGILVTETMIVSGIEYGNEFEKIAAYISTLTNLSKAYIAAPTRPPAEKWAAKPPPSLILLAFNIFREKLGGAKVALLTSPEPGKPLLLEPSPQEILRTIKVHPLTVEAIKQALGEEGVRAAEQLVREGYALRVEYMGKTYYVADLRRQGKKNWRQQ